MKYVLASTIGMLTMVFLVGAQAAQDSKFTNKEVMQKAMKGGLMNKVASGKASDEEKKQLVELFTALHENTPKKGDAENWKKMTDALVKAAKDSDGKALKLAANCAACHKEFKGK